MIRAAGATIVHCPSSNAFLESGVMPLRRWLDEGLSIGLGTDVAGGPTLSMWNDDGLHRFQNPNGPLKEANPTVKPAEAFHLATKAAAHGLGLKDRIGSLDKGMDADFVAVIRRLVDRGARRKTPLIASCHGLSTARTRAW